MRIRPPAPVLLAGALSCAAVLAGGCTDSDAKGSDGKGEADAIEVERSTAAAAPQTGTSGLPAGTPKQLWQADIPLRSPLVRVESVAGQIVVVSDRGLDVYDGAGGKPRWHYHEVKRVVTAYTVTPDTVVVTTAAAGVSNHPLRENAKPRSAALDAATGRTLWTSERRLASDDGLLPVSERIRTRAVLPAANAGTAVLARQDGDKPGLAGMDARTGKERWTWTAPKADKNCKLEQQNTDGSLVVVRMTCAAGEVFALDPASGAVRWTKPLGQGTQQYVVRGGVTLLTAYDVRKQNVSTLIAADGRQLWRLADERLAAKEVAVAGGHAVVTVANNDGGYGLRAEFVDLRTGKVDARPAARLHTAFGTVGEHVYGVREWLGEHRRTAAGLPPGLLPAGLDVIDPARGAVTTVPLPFALTKPEFEFGPASVLIKGDRLFRLQSVDAGLRITAYGPGDTKAPAGTGGVPAADWPDACKLTAKAEDVTERAYDPESTLRLGTAEIEHWGCRVGGRGTLRFRIGWVARTPEDAHALLAGTNGTAVPDVGDETYSIDGPAGKTILVRTGRYIVAYDTRSAGPGGFPREVMDAVHAALR